MLPDLRSLRRLGRRALARIESFVPLATLVCLVPGCRSSSGSADHGARDPGPVLPGLRHDVFTQEGAAYPLPYYFHAPGAATADGGLYPMVLYLHGWGDDPGRTQAVAAMLSEEAQSLRPFFVLAPECPRSDEWINRHDKAPFANYDQSRFPESTASRLTFALIASLVAKYPIDPKRISITGFSMGGSGTWDFVTRHPGAFSAALPVSGVNDPRRAPAIRDLPLWVFHGEKDDVSPVTNSRAMVRALQALGSPVRYTELSGVGHNSASEAYKDPRFAHWLTSNSLP